MKPGITRQKIQAVLRKAGFPASKKQKGGRWISGYAVDSVLDCERTAGYTWEVYFHNVNAAALPEERVQARRENAARYLDTLRSAGIDCDLGTGIRPGTTVLVRG